MCVLCGALAGGRHWSDAASQGSFADAGKYRTRNQERLARIPLINRVLVHYGLELKDLAGTAYVLFGPTGASEVVNSLPDLWPAVERQSRQRCDPLEPKLMATLSGTKQDGK